MTQINYPFGFDSRGHTAETNEEKHIRDLIEQVLFTSPGERVNRPSFGSGLLQLIFAPNSDVLAAATQSTVQGALQQWLGELIQVEAVNVQNEDSTLQVLVQYTVRRTQQRQVAQFVRGGL
ncbi:GPW/gp25 family protein [Nostoc sp. FACHB-973]|nr:GPW/gp25 family protein [Nostoc sp. FACHB-973]